MLTAEEIFNPQFDESITIVTGSNDNDTLRGNELNNIIIGSAGDDVLQGKAGNDTLDGGAGSDRLAETANVDFTLTNTQLTGLGTDVIRNIELVRLNGGVSNNTIDASGATDIQTVLVGDAGNDTLMGSQIGDQLYGGSGSDLLDGNAGDDTLVGGANADIFVLEAAMGTDTIKDFQNGVDKFGLSASLGFNDLSINSNTNGAGVLIADTTNNNELLTIVNGVNVNGITAADFISI